MGVTIIITKFKDGQEQSFSKDEIEKILSDYAKEKGNSTVATGIDYLRHQPWFEDCDFPPDGNDITAIVISKPNTEIAELEEVIFRLLAIKNSVLMSEHFDLFHSRTDIISHFPAEMREMLTDMDEDEEDENPVKIINSAQEVWPATYKGDS